MDTLHITYVLPHEYIERGKHIVIQGMKHTLFREFSEKISFGEVTTFELTLDTKYFIEQNGINLEASEVDYFNLMNHIKSQNPPKYTQRLEMKLTYEVEGE